MNGSSVFAPVTLPRWKYTRAAAPPPPPDAEDAGPDDGASRAGCLLRISHWLCIANRQREYSISIPYAGQPTSWGERRDGGDDVDDGDGGGDGDDGDDGDGDDGRRRGDGRVSKRGEGGGYLRDVQGRLAEARANVEEQALLRQVALAREDVDHHLHATLRQLTCAVRARRASDTHHNPRVHTKTHPRVE